MANKLKADEIALAIQLIEKANSIVVTSHKNPDGDAVGSALAMHHFLTSLGKKVTTILPDSVPEFLQWLPGYESIVIFDKQTEEAKKFIEQADLLFSLDYNHLGRVGTDMEAALASATGFFILIDHHQSPGSFAQVIYSDTSACSTCEMIYHFIHECYGKSNLNIAMAQCIYCGIMTDSGSFRFPSVTQVTHEIAGELIALGLDHAEVHRNVYDTNLLDRLKLIGYALSEKLEVISDCGVALIWLNQNELLRFNHRQGDTESLVNQALSIKGVKLSAFFREGNSEIKLSFRSKGSFDVNQFARAHWNGGGHMNAAGGSSSLSMAETIEKFKQLVHSLQTEITQS